jgi:hypothetical protein
MAIGPYSGYKQPQWLGTSVVDRTAWVAALEQLPPDPRGFRRTLRLHAVAAHSETAAPRAACGYAFQPDELRPTRTWDSVTESGRCALCELQLRRATADSAVDLVEPQAVDLVERPAAAGGEPASGSQRRLSIVPDESASETTERRSPGRP